MQDVRTGRNGGVFTGLYTMAEEKLHNPFLLTSDQEVQSVVKSVGDAVKTMAALREAKNQGKFAAQL